MPLQQKIDSLHIDKLKGLEGFDISFEDKNITAIFGENGCGKSTVLHALACFYRAEDPNAETNYFTRFFKKVGGAAWAGSKMTAQFTINDISSTIVYEKAADRWKPRINQRLQRNTYYIGIDSCVPSIEKETVTKTSYSMNTTEDVANKNLIIRAASQIMGRCYEDYAKPHCGKRKYKKVNVRGGIQYTSLSMGAGEQRIFTILDKIYSAPEYSLILVDELDLTMHTTAFMRLLDIMVSVARERKLQIVFTTHREEIASRTDINIRHIWKPANQNQSLCLNQTNPMCIYRLNGTIQKPYEVYVEDDLAEAIVNSVLREEKILNYVKVIRFGDASNAFSVAAGLHIQGQLSDKQLIIIDGDVYRTQEEKLKIMKKRYSGNEAGKDEVRQIAVSSIKQFNLPANEHPEHFLWSILKTKQGLLAEFANRIFPNANDQHRYLYEIYELQGESRPVFLKELVELLQTDPAWNNYVSEVRTWAQRSRVNIGV